MDKIEAIEKNMNRESVNSVPIYPNESVIIEPFSYLLQIPGKGMRSRLINAFNIWFKISNENARTIGKVVQKLHTASLLIDDIEDNSKLRRGIPAAHLVYGVPWTINCANYMYFEAMKDCTKLGIAKATEAFLSEMINLHTGQGFDIYWRDTNTCPTEEEYLNMVSDKTGGLFRLAIKLMGCFSDEPLDEYIELVDLLGVYFQIRDDYINVASANYSKNKTFFEDLTEGKFSFPIIHAITSNPGDRRMLNILKQRTEDIDIKKYVIDYMKKTGSFEYTEGVMKEYVKKIFAKLEDLGGNKDLEQIISDLSDINYHSVKDKPKPSLKLENNDNNNNNNNNNNDNNNDNLSKPKNKNLKSSTGWFQRTGSAKLKLSSERIDSDSDEEDSSNNIDNN
eukprot:TRINITY_DN6281_c0_g2_i1.p1 TRINITY_DN6281_c0_g2~~TRINITY_DN6281_c0_g2_i1.p1  ORF type:complete len:394 (-),score=137.38 TRINITY_DN6281_c0_g2_i1:41-1222(-)